MDGYFATYYTNPDEMIGASRPKQNYAMHRQLLSFKAGVRRVDSFSVERLYRHLQAVIPQNLTVNSLGALRDVIKSIPPSPQRHKSKMFFKMFFEYIEDLRRLAWTFKDRIYTVLYEFFYDSSFIRLRDLQVKTGGLVKGQGQGLSPDLIKEVGELCRQLSLDVDSLEENVNNWEELLGESEIDPTLFDETSAYRICQFKDCNRFENILRLVPDVLNKSEMSVDLARDWWCKAEHIRQKLAGNPASDSGMSSSSEMDAPSVMSKASQKSTRQVAKNNPVPKQPVDVRKKVKSLADMDKERTSYVNKPAPALEPGNHGRSNMSKSVDRSGGSKKNAKPEATRETGVEGQHENGKSFAKRQPDNSNDRSPLKRSTNQKLRKAKAESKSDDFETAGGENQVGVAQKSQASESKMTKNTTDKARVRNRGGEVQRRNDSQQHTYQADGEDEAAEDNSGGQTDEEDAAKRASLPDLQPQPRGKKMRDQDVNKNQESTSPIKNENGKMPSIHNDGDAKVRPKAPAQARSTNAKTAQEKYQEQPIPRNTKEALVSMQGTEDSMETLTLEHDLERQEQESRGSGPLSWQEKKLEKLCQKLEELIESKETQQAALKLLTVMKDNVAREVTKYRGSHRLKRRLQARVALLTEKAHGWKEETKSLDYQHRLLSEDLRLEMKLNGSFYRQKRRKSLKERIAYLNEIVRSERLGMEELLHELGKLKDVTDQLMYYGFPFEPYFGEFEMEFGRLGGYIPDYWYKHGALGGSLQPNKVAKFLRDEELLLGRSLQSRYERSIWDALKRESVDSMPLLSPEDSFSFPSLALEESMDVAARGSRGRKEQGQGYQGDDDYSSDSDGGDDERSGDKKQQPQMYDLKRDEKQPPSFVPI
ncbi:uncharacterized protein LOC110976865 [Acanthaster planci]|uniref:Uncharacterized protein LOC110976865 n=1 Tax=Acanthaster planci TaxID=133434 RepID=A0A8B7XZ80_ACAPL|nr:uncharacterized protein LOC110976865 [Acanthaster planci]